MSSTARARIVIIEDDATLAHLLQAYLQNLRYQVRWAADGPSGLETALSERPDLVLLDVSLPTMNGYEVCRNLRAASDVPIVYLTSAADEEDIVAGLHQGADGYVCKPCGLLELAARIEATLRRHEREKGRTRVSVYDDGILLVDTDAGTVRKRGQDVSLTPKEQRLLCYLVRHAENVVSYSELLQVVWGNQYQDARNYVSLYVRYLRLKIEDDPAHPQYLLTRFGIGYYFSPRRGKPGIGALTEGAS